MNNIMLKIVLPLFGIVAILGFITWLAPIKQQDAAWVVSNTQHYTCGNVVVYLQPSYESPSCSTGRDSSATSYKSGIYIWATGATSQYTIHWNWASYWCPNNSTSPCLQNGTQTGADTHTLTTPFTAYSQLKTPTSQYVGQACGVYQNDFGFYVTENSTNRVYCAMNLNNLGYTNNNASWCNTLKSCQAPTPSATPTPRPTATPTVPTATPTVPTATPTVPTATPTPTATPVPPTPTGTSTNTNNCGDTTQVGVNGSNNNNNCNQNQNNNNNNNNNSQSQSQTQNNNQSVNITLNNEQPQQQQQQQQVLAASTGPTELPKTGAESDILFGLLALIPVGWKIRKLV